MHENQKGTRGLTNSSVLSLPLYIKSGFIPKQQKENDADTQQYIDNGMFSL